MFRKITLLFLALVFLLVAVGAAFSADGNERKGKYLYRKVYKTCNARGEVDSPKPILNPDARTQNGWTEMFESKTFDEFKCAEEWGALSDEDLLHIYTYLHAHASDSGNPAKCK